MEYLVDGMTIAVSQFGLNECKTYKDLKEAGMEVQSFNTLLSQSYDPRTINLFIALLNSYDENGSYNITKELSIEIESNDKIFNELMNIICDFQNYNLISFFANAFIKKALMTLYPSTDVSIEDMKKFIMDFVPSK